MKLHETQVPRDDMYDFLQRPDHRIMYLPVNGKEKQEIQATAILVFSIRSLLEGATRQANSALGLSCICRPVGSCFKAGHSK